MMMQFNESPLHWKIFIALQLLWLFSTPIRNVYLYTLTVNSLPVTVHKGANVSFISETEFLTCSAVWAIKDGLGGTFARIRHGSCDADSSGQYLVAHPHGYLTNMLKRVLSLSPEAQVKVEIDVPELKAAYSAYLGNVLKESNYLSKVNKAMNDPLSSAPLTYWGNYQGFYLDANKEVERLKEVVRRLRYVKTWEDPTTSYGRPVIHDNVFRVASCMNETTAAEAGGERDCKDLLPMQDIVRSFVGTVEGYAFNAALGMPSLCQEKKMLLDTQREVCADLLVETYGEAIFTDILHGDLPIRRGMAVQAASGRSIGQMLDVSLAVFPAEIAKMGSEGWGDITLSPHWAAVGYHKTSCLSLHYYPVKDCDVADLYSEIYRDYNSYLNEGLAYRLPIWSSAFNRTVFGWWIPRTEFVTWDGKPSQDKAELSSSSSPSSSSAQFTSVKDVACKAVVSTGADVDSILASDSPWAQWCQGKTVDSVGSYYVESGCGIGRIIGLSKWGTARHFHLDKFQGCRFLQYEFPLLRKTVDVRTSGFKGERNCIVSLFNSSSSTALSRYSKTEEMSGPYKMGTSDTYLGLDIWVGEIVSTVRCYGVETQKAYSQVLGLGAANEVSMSSVIKACLFGQTQKCQNIVQYSRDNVEAVYASLNYLLIFVQHALWAYVMASLFCKLQMLRKCIAAGIVTSSELWTCRMGCALDIYCQLYYALGAVGRLAVAMPIVLSLANMITRTCDALAFGEESLITQYKSLYEGAADHEDGSQQGGEGGGSSSRLKFGEVLKLLFWLAFYSSLAVEVLTTPNAVMDLAWYRQRYPSIIRSSFRFVLTSLSMIASATLLRGTTLFGVPVDSNLLAIVIFMLLVQATIGRNKVLRKKFPISGAVGDYLSAEGVKDAFLVDASLQHQETEGKRRIGTRFEVLVAFAGVYLWPQSYGAAVIGPNSLRHADDADEGAAGAGGGGSNGSETAVSSSAGNAAETKETARTDGEGEKQKKKEAPGSLSSSIKAGFLY